MTFAIDRYFLSIFRNSMPGLFVLLFIFLTILPYGTPGLLALMPPLALVGVFHWGIYRPDLLPKLMVFSLGLLQDVVSGGPIGMWSAIYLLVHAVMGSQRKFFLGKAFALEWLSFILVVPIVFFLIWITGVLFYGALADTVLLIAQAIITIAVYPFLVWLMGKFRQLIGGI